MSLPWVQALFMCQCLTVCVFVYFCVNVCVYLYPVSVSCVLCPVSMSRSSGRVSLPECRSWISNSPILADLDHRASPQPTSIASSSSILSQPTYVIMTFIAHQKDQHSLMGLCFCWLWSFYPLSLWWHWYQHRHQPAIDNNGVGSCIHLKIRCDPGTWIAFAIFVTFLAARAVGVGDTLSDSIQCLNFAEKWFNSIYDSILLTQNSIQTIIQFKINSGDSIQKIIQCNSWGIIDTGWIRKVPKKCPKVGQTGQTKLNLTFQVTCDW